MNESEQWLLDEIAAGRNDASLPTRFHWVLVNRILPNTTYAESMRRFLSTCASAGIKAKANPDGRFVFGMFRVLPEPQRPPYIGENER